jgi:hypothetical protein
MNFTSSKKLIAKGRLIMMAALLVAGVMLGTTTTLAETDNVIVNETTKMAALDAVYWDGLGSSGLAIEGTTVVAGSSVASYASYDRAGAAYVFDCSTLPCRQASKLLASDRSDNAGLGYSIAISGTTVVVGTNGLPDAVYVFDLADCTTICFESQKLTASDGGDYDAFGLSVAVAGQTVVVGAAQHSYGGKAYAGAAYVFDLGTCGPACTETRKLTANDAAASDRLGRSVAVDGTTAVVGSTGKKAGYVFDLATCGAACTEVSKLTNSEATAAFGETVDISGSTAILGAASPPSGESWGAYVFDLATCGSACTEVSKLISSDFQADDIFGYSVAIDGTTALVGAFANDDRSEESAGSAYVFNVATCGAACTESTKLLASNPFMNKKFGIAVGVSGTTIAVSGPGDNTGKGSVYLFTGRDLSLDNRVFTDGFEY